MDYPSYLDIQTNCIYRHTIPNFSQDIAEIEVDYPHISKDIYKLNILDNDEYVANYRHGILFLEFCDMKHLEDFSKSPLKFINFQH